jgi:hypothetical protein
MADTRDVIASRTYELRNPDGTTAPVTLRIRRPFRANGPEHRCKYEIDGLARRVSMYAAGEDEVQALWLGLVGAGLHLRHSPEGRAGRITFGGGPDLFLPPAEGVADPEWHGFEMDGRPLHWRRYAAWHQEPDGRWTRHWALEVTSRPGALGIGATHPAETSVGVEHARALVRLAEESDHPIRL